MQVTETDFENLGQNIKLSPIKRINEEEIHKKLVKFISMLNVHVSTWQNTIGELSGPVRGVTNLSEQLRGVEQAKIAHMDNFSAVQESLVANILNTIEDELIFVIKSAETLANSTNNYKSALYNLEKSTEFLDFNSRSELVIGNATQPALAAILQDGLKILILYNAAVDEITKCIKNLDFRDEVEMSNFKKALEQDFCNERVVRMLLATTQYFDNKNVVL